LGLVSAFGKVGFACFCGTSLGVGAMKETVNNVMVAIASNAELKTDFRQ
jgi:hypothetical protein